MMEAAAHPPPLEIATELLFREASHLDEQRWDEWLGLFFEDCEYWVPTWRNESELISDPTREVSFIYYSRRTGLEDRVGRVRSGRSPASSPLLRTLHTVSNIVCVETAPDRIAVRSKFVVYSFWQRRKETRALFGHYEHELCKRDRWGIRRKKILLLNDHIDSVVDFYLL